MIYENKIFEPLSLQKTKSISSDCGIEFLIYYHNKFSFQNKNNFQGLYYQSKIINFLPDIIFFEKFDEKLSEYFKRNGCIIIDKAKIKNKSLLSKSYTKAKAIKILKTSKKFVPLKRKCKLNLKSYAYLNTAFKKRFFKFIQNKYNNYINFIRQKKELISLNNSFEILEGQTKVMLSAPHNVKQIRELKLKPVELGTGHLLLYLSNKTNCPAIIKTNCIGIEGKKNDDANFDFKHPYKIALSNYIKAKEIKYFIDLHSMQKLRGEQINIGINKGINIQNNYALLDNIKNIFTNKRFKVSIDYPFDAKENTISKYIAKENKIFCLQIEINSKLIHLKDKEQQFKKIANCLIQIINYLNNII